MLMLGRRTACFRGPRTLGEIATGDRDLADLAASGTLVGAEDRWLSCPPLCSSQRWKRPKSCESKCPRRCDEDFPEQSGAELRATAPELFSFARRSDFQRSEAVHRSRGAR